MQMRQDIYDFYTARNERAEREDSFLTAFGSKHGSDRRKQRRQRKGWDS